MSLLKQKPNGSSPIRILSIKCMYLAIVLTVFGGTSKISLGGYYKEFNHLAYRDLRNKIIEDLWFAEIPEPNTVIYFLDEVASTDWPLLADVKDGSRTAILEYYRDLLKKIYKGQERLVTNARRSMNIDLFIDQLKNTPGPYSFSDEVISKALRIIAGAKVTY